MAQQNVFAAAALLLSTASSAWPASIEESPRSLIEITQPPSVTREGVVSDVAPGALRLAPGTRDLGIRHAPPTAGTRSIASLDVLVVIYTSGMGAEQIEQANEGIAFARDFYWRNSLAQLNLNPSVLDIPTKPPDLLEISMAPIEEDLRQRGVSDNQYSAIFVTEGEAFDGHGLNGCFGGFILFGQTAGAYCPIFGNFYNIPDPAWSFIHEFQHALDLIIAGGSGFPDMIFGHPYEGASYCENLILFPDGIDYGAHFDWEAGTLRLFTHYAELQEPWNRPIIVTDSDADGMPDDEPRVAVDEARLGTDPFDPDTDNDRLNDLSEFTAAVFRGTDPLHPDTDGDRRRDGRDPLPLYLASPRLQSAFRPIVLDGSVMEPSWRLLTEGVRQGNIPEDAGLEAFLYATWDSNAFYLAVETSELPGYVDIQIDGSGTNGPWIGADFFYLRADLHDQVLLTKQYVSERVLEIVPEEWGPADLTPLVVPGSRVAVSLVGDLWTAEIAIPKNIGLGFGQEIRAEGKPPKMGLSLEQGRVIGLDVRLNKLGGIPDPNSDDGVLIGQWASLTELLDFLDLTLTREKRRREEPEPSLCDLGVALTGQ
jgi:hypothetical protein